MFVGKNVRKSIALLLILIMTLGILAGCTSDNSGGEVSGIYKPGSYKVDVEGHGGNISLEISFSQDEIQDIKILEQGETDNIGAPALDRIKEEIISQQSLAIDSVSGATISSQAMLEAVEEAVKEAGGNVENLKSKEVEKENQGKVEKLETDVIVIGAGASGVSAAVAAADQGAEVILLEKTGVIGGASNLSWAGKMYNSSAALEEGLQVDVEKEIEDWVVNNHWRVDSAAIRQYVTKSGETYDWLREKGYVTQFLNFAGEHLHVLPDYESREVTLREILGDTVEKQGGQVITEARAKELLTDENGDVIGVIAEKTDGTSLEVKGKNVIIATGGYAANKEMVKEHFGFEGINGGLGQNIGEGLEMAWNIGAKVPDNLGGQMLHQTLARATKDLRAEYEPFQASYPLMLTYLPNFINVGPSGARFRNERDTLTAVAAANTSAFQGSHHYVIVSKEQIDKLMAEGMDGINAPQLPGMPPEFYMDFADKFTLDNPWKDADKVFESMVEGGNGFKGETIEELAGNSGMDEELLVKTFNNYVEACETGIDTEFGKAKEFLIPMGEGPYYAIIAEVNNLGSIGGLLVNTDFQVLNDERVPIRGLYAVGAESEGVLFNDTYVGNGVGLGYAFTSGRLGGQAAGKNALDR